MAARTAKEPLRPRRSRSRDAVLIITSCHDITFQCGSIDRLFPYIQHTSTAEYNVRGIM